MIRTDCVCQCWGEDMIWSGKRNLEGLSYPLSLSLVIRTYHHTALSHWLFLPHGGPGIPLPYGLLFCHSHLLMIRNFPFYGKYPSFLFALIWHRNDKQHIVSWVPQWKRSVLNCIDHGFITLKSMFYKKIYIYSTDNIILMK